MVNIKSCDHGEVVLIAGGEKCYTDIAARFCHSNRSLDDILVSPYDAKLVNNILASGHLAASEFDYFIFGITGYARVTEIQLVRKRLASYLISSGRDDRKGTRSYDVVMPNNIMDLSARVNLDPNMIFIDYNGEDRDIDLTLNDVLDTKFLESHGLDPANLPVHTFMDTTDILNVLETWYNTGIDEIIPEEDLRYMKPQGTEFKAIIGMDAHALLDWFTIRCCNRAQHEIRQLAKSMMNLCKEAQPDLFKDAGPSCVRLGYCPENSRQCLEMRGKMITKKEAFEVLKKYKSHDLVEKPDGIKSIESMGDNLHKFY